ncbi:type I restriction enzyme S subunit [Actinoplanes tereljensis]|nr:hypothetical protein [Actinoplanes tereljensis]
MGVRWYGKGAYDRGVATTETVKAKVLYRARQGDFTFNRIDTQKGAFDVVAAGLDGALATNEFPLYEVDPEQMDANFLILHFQQPDVLRRIGAVRAGSEGRARWKEDDFEAWTVPVPPLDVQARIIEVVRAVDKQIAALDAEATALTAVLRCFRAHLITGLDTPVVRADQAFEITMGRQRAPKYAAGPYMTPYLRSANVGYGALNLSDVLEMNFDPTEREVFGLVPGDVLVSEGSASHSAVGMSAMWRGELPEPICFQKTLMRFRAIRGVSIPAFVNHWCQWAYESGTFLDIAGGTNIKHITAMRAVRMPVQLPDVATQEQIADQLDAVSDVVVAARAEALRLRSLRLGLLSGLLDRTIEIESAG